MSQENQNTQPVSESPSPKSPSQEKIPFWRTSLANLLRKTIGLLETTAVKLETEPSADIENKPGLLQKLQQLWIGLLEKIRLILPARFSAKLTDKALTGIIGGLIVIIFLVTSNIFPSKPSQIVTVSPDIDKPSLESKIESDIALEKETLSKQEPETLLPIEPKQETITKEQEPETLLPIEPKQEIITEEQEPETLSPIESNQKTIAKEQEPETLLPIQPQPETITEEEKPENQLPVESNQEIITEEKIEEKLETETTLPPIPLTPEETLIAAIQNQIGEISLISEESNSENQTLQGIIESIKANFLESNLIIQIKNDWYSLEKSQQDLLAAKILQRSYELDFTHLEITDLQGKLIARNPVIGTEMIIFKRKS